MDEMMSGPLSRLCASSDLLQLEDEASIPWTYVGSCGADQVDDDAAVVTYTTQGASKKRRKTSRKRNEGSDVKPSKPLDPESQDWTEEDEFSLCQAVAIALQKTSFQNNSSSSSTDLQANINSSVVENIPTQATLRRELQRVNLSKVLVGCFVPTHEYEDVVARVRSNAFCRMFTSFSHSKAERHQHEASLVKTDSDAESSCGGSGIDTRDASQDGEQEKPGEAVIKAANSTEIKGKRLHSSSDSMEQVQMQGEVKQTHDEQESRTERVQGDQKKQGRSGVTKRKETCHPMKRSSSRLKGKRHHLPIESTDKTQVGDREDKPTPKLFSPVHVVGETELPVATPTGRASIDLNCELETSNVAHEKKQTAVKKETCPTRGAPANSELRRIQRQGRNTKSLWRPTVEDQSAKVPPKVDLSVKSSPEIQVELKNVASHAPQPQKTKNGQKCEETKSIAESVEQNQSSSGPPLAALGNPQQNTKDEKRSFKSFRKKLLDRCLEVQNSTLVAAGKVPSLRCSDTSKLHLDEYLTMQQVQQGRKSVLDACLLAQRDIR